MISCSGKCGKRVRLLGGIKITEGWTTRSDKKESRELSVDISVPRGVDRHEGELELTFTPRYCEKIEIKDKIGKDGDVVSNITVRVDIKSDKWRDLVKDD